MSDPVPASLDLPILEVRNQRAWSRWLEKNHASSRGVWLRLGKKNSTIPLVNYLDAVEEALCFGWIDGQTRSLDADSFIQRFTPRNPRSIWSKVNRGKAERLIEGGRMRPAGFAAIERAKGNGRWDAAYDGMAASEVPEDLQRALAASPEAQRSFEKLTPQQRYAVLVRIQIAHNPPVRARRIASMVAKLERNEPIITIAAQAFAGKKPMNWIAFLRAVNVGGHGKLSMSELVNLAANLGLHHARTLMQTGNLFFDDATRTAGELTELLEGGVAQQLGISTQIIVLNDREIRKAIENNPFPEEAKRDPAHLLLMPLKKSPGPARMKALESAIVGREMVRNSGRLLYVYYPDGVGRSKLTIALIERTLGTVGTGRNWNTVLKVAAKMQTGV